MFYLVTVLFIGKETVFWSLPFASRELCIQTRAESVLVSTNCIKAAVGTCVIVVVRTPRCCFGASACGEQQCQRGKPSTCEHSHVDPTVRFACQDSAAMEKAARNDPYLTEPLAGVR